MDGVRSKWPAVPPRALKDRLISMFRQATSREALQQFTCASCAESCFLINRCTLSISDEKLRVLVAPEDEYGELYRRMTPCLLSSCELFVPTLGTWDASCRPQQRLLAIICY